MLHVYAAMPTPHDLCYKETGFTHELVKPVHLKGRTHSDDLSTAAPSPEASPLFGPEQNSPLCGPDELLLPDLSTFQLPDAQDSGSDAEFELSGFDRDESTASTGGELELTGFEDDKDAHLALDLDCNRWERFYEHEISDAGEDAVSELLDLLSELTSLRADTQPHQEESGSSLQKIPYPQLDSGFLPTEFMPMQSWLLPPGRAATGKWACAMAPRPGKDSMEPLNIIIGQSGVTLEATCGWPEECWSECEQKLASKAKEVFRRRRGRSRSPFISLEEIEERQGPRGRPRHLRC